LYYILLKDCPLSNREESCEFDKVKLEVEEAEMTVEEHGVNLDSTEDHHRLVDINNSCLSAKCIGSGDSEYHYVLDLTQQVPVPFTMPSTLSFCLKPKSPKYINFCQQNGDFFL